MTEQDLIENIARAIAHEEHWFKQGRVPSVSRASNNPGCMDHWKDEGGWAKGQRMGGKPYPERNGVVVFPDEETGWKALRAQCRINVLKRQLTWLEFFAGKKGVYKGFKPRVTWDISDGLTAVDYMAEKHDPARYAQRVMDRVCAPLGIAMTLRTPVYAVLAAVAKGGEPDARDYRPVAA